MFTYKKTVSQNIYLNDLVFFLTLKLDISLTEHCLKSKITKKIQIKKFLLISILFLLTHKKLRDVRYRVKILRNLAPQAKLLVFREKHEIIRQ